MAEQRADLPRMVIPGGIHIASSVRMQGIRPELLLGLLVLSDMCIRQGVTLVITHILDGRHMHNSLHYTGAAVDVVLEQVADRILFVAELRSRLGKDFDVIDEGDHIHIEYQPHDAVVT